MIDTFFENREIFITGGSGVVGKALIEKILRSCNVKKIYILLRPKKTSKENERLEKLCKDKIFNRLLKEKPEELKKLIAVPGDATLPRLGITQEWCDIMQNVSIVFHSAATVRFDEPLNVALKLNVGGTLECLNFAENLKNLKMFMHVSTYYSNPYLKYTEPKMYSSPMNWKFCLELANDETKLQTLDYLTKKLIVGFPNTYTFTKNMAESLVNDYRERLPLIIFRPSIVLYSIEEPEPGFPTTMLGAMGVFVVVGAGILKSVYIHPKTRLDFSPQDLCVKSMLFFIVKGSQMYEQNKQPNEVPVFLGSSCGHLHETFKEVSEKLNDYDVWAQASFMKTWLIPGCCYTDSYLLYMLITIFKGILPALLGDALIKLSGRKPPLLSALRKSFIALKVMEPFMFNNFDSPGLTYFDEIIKQPAEFNVANGLKLGQKKQEFIASTTQMVYKIREHLLHESFDSLLLARRILEIKKLIYLFVRAFLAYYFLRWLYRAVFGN